MIITKKVCDKCKKEIQDNAYTDQIFPKFRIEMQDIDLGTTELDLCLHCQEMLKNWLDGSGNVVFTSHPIKLEGL